MYILYYHLYSPYLVLEQFLKGMELDAKERARKRKRNEADADLLKSKGNKEFKSGCYQEAVKCYTEAIKLVKYIPALYTNRAQVRLVSILRSRTEAENRKLF